jgi:hypothetical protein
VPILACTVGISIFLHFSSAPIYYLFFVFAFYFSLTFVFHKEKMCFFFAFKSQISSRELITDLFVLKVLIEWEAIFIYFDFWWDMFAYQVTYIRMLKN